MSNKGRAAAAVGLYGLALGAAITGLAGFRSVRQLESALPQPRRVSRVRELPSASLGVGALAATAALGLHRAASAPVSRRHWASLLGLWLPGSWAAFTISSAVVSAAHGEPIKLGTLSVGRCSAGNLS